MFEIGIFVEQLIQVNVVEYESKLLEISNILDRMWAVISVRIVCAGSKGKQ